MMGNAMRRILKLGGKQGLNCIAELDPEAVEQIGCPGDLPLSGVPVAFLFSGEGCGEGSLPGRLSTVGRCITYTGGRIAFEIAANRMGTTISAT